MTDVNRGHRIRFEALVHIVYVLPKLEYFAHGRRGRVAHAIGVVQGLIENGCRVTVISGPGLRSTLNDQRVDVLEIPGVRGGIGQSWFWTRRLIASLNDLLREDSSIDGIVVRYGASNAFQFLPAIARHPTRSWCFEINSLAYHQVQRLPRMIRSGMRAAERHVLSRADLLYVISKRLADDIGAMRRTRVSVIPNGGYPRAGQVLREPGDGIVRFTYFGVFQPYYDLQFLLRSFQQLRQQLTNVELHLYGDGAQFDSVRRSASNLPGVYIHGRYDPALLFDAGHIDKSSVLVLPCKPDHGGEFVSPIKLYEYMSLGLPILASEVGQAAELLVENQTACFYDPSSIDSCAAAMHRLACDASLRLRLGANARADLERNHTWRNRMRTLQDALSVVRKGQANAQ